MSIALLAKVLGAMLLLRACLLAAMLRDLASFWSDLERRGALFQLARLLDGVTLAAFFVCSVYALWNLDPQATWPWRLGKVFVAWLGIALLSRLRIHAFPRTNSPQLYAMAKIDLLVHLILSLLSALVLTALTALVFWWRE